MVVSAHIGFFIACDESARKKRRKAWSPIGNIVKYSVVSSGSSQGGVVDRNIFGTHSIMLQLFTSETRESYLNLPFEMAKKDLGYK